jgi:ribosome recycling factor
MALDDILLETEEKMVKTEEHVVHQFAGVRTGKASAGLIENVMVEAYGANMRLKELASISTPEHRMLLVQPFDQATIKAIEKAIQSSGLGLNPANQGRFLRIVLPDLSTERRQEFVKLCKKYTEEGRVAIRNERRAALELMKKAAKEGVSEDEVEVAETEVQKLTDSYIAKIEAHLVHKEKEILTV